MPRLELLHSKEQLFLLDLSQKAEKRCLPTFTLQFYAADHPGFVLGLKTNICMPVHTGNEEKAGYLNLGERNANYNYILSTLYVLAIHYL